MQVITLTKNFLAYVDDEDYERVNCLCWYVLQSKKNSTQYAQHSGKTINGKRNYIKMHHFILNKSYQSIDHINGNGLDNRKENLRVCSNKENSRNRYKKKGKSTSKYKGVVFVAYSYINKLGIKNKRKNPWYARIMINNKICSLGYFETEEFAAQAYNKAIITYYGEFAKLNIIK